MQTGSQCRDGRRDGRRPLGAAAGAASRTGPSPRGATPAAVASSGQAPVRPVSWNPSAGAPMDFDSALAAATVRIRIEDADGHSCGTGTIIDSRQGDALILTCGHVFRDSKGQGKIEVDLFGPTPATRVPARLITYDLKRDIGLITIRAPGPIAVARVAPLDYVLQPGQTVASVGCNNGDAPTVQHSRITNLNRFLGPPNIQVAGQPVVGRSGGGLFSADGRVIGVCNAADPSDREGLFAGLASIQAALDDTKLTYVYKPDARAPCASRPPRPIPSPRARPQSRRRGPACPRPRTRRRPPLPLMSPKRRAIVFRRGGRHQRTAPPHQGGAPGHLRHPQLPRPGGQDGSAHARQGLGRFLKQLAAKAQPQDGRYYTSLEVPARASRSSNGTRARAICTASRCRGRPAADHGPSPS